MSTEIKVDDETRAALLLFNERVEAAAARERGVKRIAKATRAKDEAASAVRTVGNDSNASKDDKVAAEATYKEAVEELRLIEADPEAPTRPKPRKEPEEEESVETTPDATSSDTAAVTDADQADGDEADPDTTSTDEGNSDGIEGDTADAEAAASAEPDSAEAESSDGSATAS